MSIRVQTYNEGLRTNSGDDCTAGRFSDGFAKRFNADRPLEEVRRDFAGRALQLNNSVITKDLAVDLTFAVGLPLRVSFKGDMKK